MDDGGDQTRGTKAGALLHCQATEIEENPQHDELGMMLWPQVPSRPGLREVLLSYSNPQQS